ncbi:MAG: hypothetical protein CFE21_05690 [Bacteroidetes bacterium B1(2017)]|nr:MAG: hypothetical protein CFE21_05690 [Bacteroidetes bacterium B1(2017)]
MQFRYYFLLLMTLISSQLAFGQVSNLDSLVVLNQSATKDSLNVLQKINISNKFRVEQLDYPSSKKYAQDALQLAEKLNYKKGVFLSKIALGFVLRDMGKRQECNQNLKSAIHDFEFNRVLFTNVKLIPNYIGTCTALAENYCYQPDFESAQKYAFQGLEWAEKYGVEKGQCWNCIAFIFYMQKNIPEAKTYTFKAINDFKEKNAIADLARAYAFLASYYYEENNLEQCVSYYKLSYEAYKKVNSLYGMRIDLYNLASVYLAMNQFENADEYASEAQKITSKDDLIGSFFISQLRAELKYSLKKYKEAIVYGNQALEFAQLENSIGDLNSCYKNLLSCYIGLQDSANAFLCSQKISQLKDSLYFTEISRSTAELAKKYESEKKEQQIQILKDKNLLALNKFENEQLLRKSLTQENDYQLLELKKNEALKKSLARENFLKNEEIIKSNIINQSLQEKNDLMAKNTRNESMVRALLVAILLISVIFGIVVYANFSKQKEVNKIVISQKEELKTLMHEMHHRVKNNLQVIAAMLRMQKRSVEDEAVINALIDSETRIQAIAMVHEKLYKAEMHSQVNLKEYLQELVSELKKQYDGSVHSFSFTLNMKDNLSSNLDTAIPLGLIVNELCANAFKHGFVEKQNAKISMELNQNTDGLISLVFKDNGQGFESRQLPEQSKSIGLKLIYLFVAQLNGNLKFEQTETTNFYISFNANS